jgi:hypothetical protein
MFDEAQAQPRASRVNGELSNRRVWWVVSIFAVVSLAALGLAGWAIFRPTPSGAVASYTDAQRADAKTKTCAAFTTVRAGVNLNTNLTAPGGPEDLTGALAVAANGRVALYDGGQYLLARLDPATPSDLADAVRKFANTLMDIGAGATAGLPITDPGQAALLKDVTASAGSIAQLCK